MAEHPQRTEQAHNKAVNSAEAGEPEMEQWDPRKGRITWELVRNADSWPHPQTS